MLWAKFHNIISLPQKLSLFFNWPWCCFRISRTMVTFTRQWAVWTKPWLCWTGLPLGQNSSEISCSTHSLCFPEFQWHFHGLMINLLATQRFILHIQKEFTWWKNTFNTLHSGSLFTLHSGFHMNGGMENRPEENADTGWTHLFTSLFVSQGTFSSQGLTW